MLKSKQNFPSLLFNYSEKSWPYVPNGTHSEKCPNFIEYFIYLHPHNIRVEKWAMSYRCFPHNSSETNAFCESFHNLWKTVYFERKANRRLDSLILTLLEIEEKIYTKHKLKLLYGCPVKFKKIYH